MNIKNNIISLKVIYLEFLLYKIIIKYFVFAIINFFYCFKIRYLNY